MKKKIAGYLLTSSVNHKYIGTVRPFLLSKTDDMFDYIKPTQRDFNPGIYILQVGTKNLSSDRSLGQISLDILNLPKSLKLNNGTVVVANTVPRDDEIKQNLMKSV